jgi:hypothetical protein
MPFAVRLRIRAPQQVRPVLGYLVKGVFDGVVCAFRAHTDGSNVAELAARVSRNVPAPPTEIEALLLDLDKAVLGSVPRLLHLRGEGVIWSPADDLCVAGELLAEQPTSSRWAIKGKIVELESR